MLQNYSYSFSFSDSASISFHTIIDPFNTHKDDIQFYVLTQNSIVIQKSNIYIFSFSKIYYKYRPNKSH